ncbi:oxygen-dependent coproporphyrinogen-III oxidase-like isoform X2 [Zophobas morio]|uniref:oxygen-dependent coproporphyrinogen-III oxidase-like isoform X2 n=1 Tax=Zophobas morio TaxID=2755281 RepID=UPI00308351B9
MKDFIFELQKYFHDILQSVDPGGASYTDNTISTFEVVEWFRNQGKNGGGKRYQVENSEVFNRATINASHVYFDNPTSSSVSSATALSAIIHPANPFMPSLHFHISFFSAKNKLGYWRMIADINPSIPFEEDKNLFLKILKAVIPCKLLSVALEFGDKYFFIPALNRRRGTCHLFIASLDDDLLRRAQVGPEPVAFCYQNCQELANKLAKEVISLYAQIARSRLLQVITLDRGTTHGLLSHSDNDVGTLGSLPLHIDLALLKKWAVALKNSQGILLERVLHTLLQSCPAASILRGKYKEDAYPDFLEEGPMSDNKRHLESPPNKNYTNFTQTPFKCPKKHKKYILRLESCSRGNIAEIIRNFYRDYPEAVHFQANMDMDWWDNKTALFYFLTFI